MANMHHHSNIALEYGETCGAKFCVASSKVHTDQSTKKVLIHCHGCIPEGIPLTADLNLSDKFYLKLLNEGWIVAMTSYRKEGLVVKDAVDDVINLREHIQNKYGQIGLCILEGESMGGAIVTMISENQFCRTKSTELFQGIIAIGAALLVKESEDMEFTHRPLIPTIYLTNTDETHIIDEYITKSKENLPNPSLKIPSLWFVRRNGHCNVNHLEKMQTYEGLSEWLKNPSSPPVEEVKDVTHVIDGGDTQVYYDADGGWGKIMHTDTWGDIYTNIQPKDLLKLGIKLGMTFKVELGGKRFHERGTEQKVVYGSNSFLSVGQGQWYAYDHAEGFIAISANGYAHPSLVTEHARVKAGDAVFIHKPVGVGAALKGIPGSVDDYLAKMT